MVSDVLAAEKVWIVWTPFSVLTLHPDSRNGGDAYSQPEVELFKERWKEDLSKPDPFYNVNLTLRYSDFSPEID